jgi:hypothetical protein
MTTNALCDICGQVVTPEEAVVADMSVSQSMCPTSMTMHPACHQAASVMWQPDDTCSVTDPDFPEMEQWMEASKAAERHSD